MRFVATVLAIAVAAYGAAASPVVAPEFTHRKSGDWLNSAPQSMAGLRGRAVLVEFWTFGCSNCRNTLPWLKAAHEHFAAKGLTIISVHTPEFPNEHDPEQVRAAVERLGIRYAVMLDNDYSYWKALNNRYWPAFYLIDRNGHIAATAIGELHSGDARADQMERAIERVLAASGK